MKISLKNSYPRSPKGMSINEWKARVDWLQFID